MSAVEIQESEAGEETPQLRPLYLYMVGCSTEQEMNANVIATIERGYTPITEYLHKSSGSVSIVGSGPSIEETYKELDRDILAINNAIKFLLAKGIVPKWAMIWDAAEICEQFAIPHPDITYLIGARCHPKVFERLKDCKVVVWHAGGDHNINDFLYERGIKEPMINGGSAGVTRAMYLAVGLGYRELHIYGGDSCYSDDGKTHVNGSLVPEKDMMISIGNNPPLFFRTTPEWCAQVNEFRDIYSLFRHPMCNVSIKVHGEGMLPYMAQLMDAKDKANLLWNADGTPHPSNIPRPVPEESQSLEVNYAGV